MSRTAVFLACILVLAGCTFPSQQQIAAIVDQASKTTPTAEPTLAEPVSPASTDAASTDAASTDALPTVEEAGAWLLTIAELKYIDNFRFFMLSWFASTDESFSELFTQYQNDPESLKNNIWRADAVEAVSKFGSYGVFFDTTAPSERFAPIAAHAQETMRYLDLASASLTQAVDQTDGEQMEKAGEAMDAARQGFNAIEALFTALIGPPD